MRHPLTDGQGILAILMAIMLRLSAYRSAHDRSCIAASSGITEDAVDFRLTHNEEDDEPVVLPGAFPNILANGSSGIAVGTGNVGYHRK